MNHVALSFINTPNEPALSFTNQVALGFINAPSGFQTSFINVPNESALSFNNEPSGSQLIMSKISQLLSLIMNLVSQLYIHAWLSAFNVPSGS